MIHVDIYMNNDVVDDDDAPEEEFVIFWAVKRQLAINISYTVSR